MQYWVEGHNKTSVLLVRINLGTRHRPILTAWNVSWYIAIPCHEHSASWVNNGCCVCAAPRGGVSLSPASSPSNVTTSTEPLRAPTCFKLGVWAQKFLLLLSWCYPLGEFLSPLVVCWIGQSATERKKKTKQLLNHDFGTYFDLIHSDFCPYKI